MAITSQDQTALLTVSAPRSLLNHTIDETVNLDQSWIDFLNTVCRLPVRETNNLEIRSSNYKPKRRLGWKTRNLNEPIRLFMEKFKIKKDRYSVTIVTNHSLRGTTTPNRHLHQNTSAAENLQRSVSGPNFGYPMNQNINGNDVGQVSVDAGDQIPPQDKESRKRSSDETPYNLLPPKKRKQSLTTENPTYPYEDLGGRDVFEEISDDNSDQLTRNNVLMDGGQAQAGHLFNDNYDVDSPRLFIDESRAMDQGEEENERLDDADDADVRSQCTVDDEAELEREGIVVTELATLAQERLVKFSNAFLLKAQAEFKKLDNKGTWIRNVQRSPFCCFILSELLKE